MTHIAAPTPQPVCPYCGMHSGKHYYDCRVVRDKGTRWWRLLTPPKRLRIRALLQQLAAFPAPP